MRGVEGCTRWRRSWRETHALQKNVEISGVKFVLFFSSYDVSKILGRVTITGNFLWIGIVPRGEERSASVSEVSQCGVFLNFIKKL